MKANETRLQNPEAKWDQALLDEHRSGASIDFICAPLECLGLYHMALHESDVL